MRINKLTLIAALASTLGAGSAMAQYDGAYVGGGLGLYKGTAELNPGSVNVGDNKHRGGLNLNLGYGRSFDRFNLAGEVSYANEVGQVSPAAGFSAKSSNLWAFSVLPGYKLTDSTLLYGRLGVGSAKLSGNALLPDSAKKHAGTVMGVGLKVAFDRNWAGVLEYQVYDGRSKQYPLAGVTIDPGASGLLLGAQYAF